MAVTLNVKNVRQNKKGRVIINMLCKIFDEGTSYLLGQEINRWLINNKINILHLKYSSTTGGYNNSTKCFSCLIMYELKYPVKINDTEDSH